MSHYPPQQTLQAPPLPQWEDVEPHHDGIADRRALHALLAQDVRRYGIVLLIGGLLNTEMAIVFALTGWPVAALAGVIVSLAMLVGIVWWSSSRPNTLRYAAQASRLFWLGSGTVWVLCQIAFFALGWVWVWWAAAVVLAGIGAGSYFLCRNLATKI